MCEGNNPGMGRCNPTPPTNGSPRFEPLDVERTVAGPLPVKLPTILVHGRLDPLPDICIDRHRVHNRKIHSPSAAVGSSRWII